MRYFLVVIFLMLNQEIFSQGNHYPHFYTLNPRQQAALAMLEQFDTSAGSRFWPAIKPAAFLSNLRRNIIYPSMINQGENTNFCSYAAITHILITYQPDVYAKSMITLYREGIDTLNGKRLQPTKKVRDNAGSLKRKGELDILPANQLWFLTLADEYRSYLNLLDPSFDPGNENDLWAASNYGKFNRMLRQLGGYQLETAGSDLIRPWKNEYLNYLSKQLKKGTVILYVNNSYLHASKYSIFKLRMPTHFIVLYDIQPAGEMILIKYWDYGLKTQQLIPPKRLRKLIFGITTILQEEP
ncbi:hypothetical protein KJS94_06630 [Flavihumibacter rivuli]|uniref:hypothetical protein n=1 Tax=Flavihumibacter rivuli TaxID=2838156 RepID=UPI001BDF4E8F|nr:hypothetical protein [Flavihumibacter rivuli]ULQ57872.1 hypothetical protein KJS94_06630 [Flavihumibacter rivuli]